MTSSGGKMNIPGIHHQGSLIQLKDGSKHLIHHGPNFGKSQDCVITSASNMKANTWRSMGAPMRSSATVGSLMKAGGSGKTYSLVTNNCINSANRVMTHAIKKNK